MYGKIKGLTLYKSVFDTIYHSGNNFGQTSGEDGWTDYRYVTLMCIKKAP